MEPYQYQPLPNSTSIRLIRLQQGLDSDDLMCSLEAFDVHNPPEYVALSYVWGDESTKVPIICDGKSVQVTSNLRDALHRISTLSTTPKLWADALCINQQDNLEKSQQVAMMAMIYSNASNVTVWLGLDPHGDAPLVFEDIQALTEGLESLAAMGGTFKRFDAETCDLHWELGNGTPIVSGFPNIAFFKPNDEDKARLERFLRLPWFSRTWVLQEVGLASEAMVIWADSVQDWQLIGVTAMFLMHHCKALLDKLGLTELVEAIRNFYMAFSPFAPRATFFHLLDKARSFNATDPRDKVFGLLSHPTSRTMTMTTWRPKNRTSFEKHLALVTRFLPDSHDVYLVGELAERWSSASYKNEELPAPLIKANYDKSVEDVYRDLAVSHIERTQSLEILTAVQHTPDSSLDLPTPTWVPRWDQYIGTPILGLYTSNHFASANRDAIVASSANPDRLIVRGHIVSRVVAHTHLLNSSSFDLPLPTDTLYGPDSPLVQRFWDNNPFAATWLSSGLARFHQAGHQYPQILNEFAGSGYALVQRESSIYEAYIRSWVNGKSEGEVDGFDLQADAKSYWERAFFGTEGDPDVTEEEREQHSDYEARWKRYRDSVANVCNKRKFFFTKKQLFGIGPGALREGDWIAILQGADVPFVLREVNEGRDESQPLPPNMKFQLVGECYVHGLMQGQAVRGRELTRDIELI